MPRSMQPEFFANSTLTPHRQTGIVIANYRLLQFNFETAGQKVPTKTDEIEPASAPRTPDAPGRARVRDDYDVYEHPYVRRLEKEVDDYKQKYDVLQAAARADLIKLHETYAVAQSETLAKYLLLDKGKATSATPETPPGQSTA